MHVATLIGPAEIDHGEIETGEVLDGGIGDALVAFGAVGVMDVMVDGDGFRLVEVSEGAPVVEETAVETLAVGDVEEAGDGAGEGSEGVGGDAVTGDIDSSEHGGVAGKGHGGHDGAGGHGTGAGGDEVVDVGGVRRLEGVGPHAVDAKEEEHD